MLFWKYVRDHCTVKENIINSVDNEGYIDLSNFVTIANGHKHFPNFLISRQLFHE